MKNIAFIVVYYFITVTRKRQEKFMQLHEILFVR